MNTKRSNKKSKQTFEGEDEQVKQSSEMLAKDTGQLIALLVKGKKTEVHFNFLVFGRFGFIGAKVKIAYSAIFSPGVHARFYLWQHDEFVLLLHLLSVQ